MVPLILYKRRKNMYYIGVDLGTSAVKLLLMEGNGKIARISVIFSTSGLE